MVSTVPFCCSRFLSMGNVHVDKKLSRNYVGLYKAMCFIHVAGSPTKIEGAQSMLHWFVSDNTVPVHLNIILISVSLIGKTQLNNSILLSGTFCWISLIGASSWSKKHCRFSTSCCGVSHMASGVLFMTLMMTLHWPSELQQSSTFTRPVTFYQAVE